MAATLAWSIRSAYKIFPPAHTAALPMRGPSMAYGFRGEEKTVNPDMHHGAMSCRTCSVTADQPWRADRHGTRQVLA
jgi:hypothetical protein